MFVRRTLAIFCMMLIAAPGWAAPSAVGTVQSSAAATLRGNSLMPGTSVFGGDTIEVGLRGNAWIAFASGSQLVLTANSKVAILPGTEAQPVGFEVLQGLARFRSSEKTPVTALLADATIRPKSGSGVGFVNVLSPTAALIGAEKGDLVVTTSHDNGTMTIPAGRTMEVRMEQDQTPPDAVHNNKKKIILVGIAIAAIGAGVGAALTLSESSHGKPISPFAP